MTTRGRQTDLAQIHIAKKALGLEDDAYRNILRTVARVSSSADLDDAGRRRVLEHFKKCGWAPSAPKSELAKSAQGRLCLAIWSRLKDAGKVRDGRHKALERFLCDQAKVSHVRFIEPDTMNRLVDTLKAWEARP